MIQPHTDWLWREQQGCLALVSGEICHQTSFAVGAHWTAPFSIDDVEHYWFFASQLQRYFADESSIAAASIDAVAALKQPWPACRGFWFDYLQQGAVDAGALVQLCGQHPANAIVLAQHGMNVLVLLLHPVTTLQGKQIPHGHVVQVPFNRVRPLPLATPHHTEPLCRSA